MLTMDRIPDIISMIKIRLQSAQASKSAHLAVTDNAWKLEDEWLYVTVHPTVKGERASDYADLMMEVEKDLRGNGIENVLLVPAITELGV